jgi:hypothetical protein
MAKFSISVRPYQCSARPNARWVLNVWHPTGKRERTYFETMEAAQAAEQVKSVEVQRLGWQALQIDDRLRLEALDARDRLAPYGVSLTAVVAEFVRRRGSASVTVEDVTAQFIASRTKLGRSGKHLSSLRRLFARFGEAFPGERLADLTSAQVEDWLHGLGVGPVTVNTYRTLLHSLFEFGVRRKFCPENPVKAVERMTVKADEVGNFSAEPRLDPRNDLLGNLSFRPDIAGAADEKAVRLHRRSGLSSVHATWRHEMIIRRNLGTRRL